MTQAELNLIKIAFEKGRDFERKKDAGNLKDWDVADLLRFGIEVGTRRGESMRVERRKVGKR